MPSWILFLRSWPGMAREEYPGEHITYFIEIHAKLDTPVIASLHPSWDEAILAVMARWWKIITRQI
jgi:hypothetical protein